MDGRDGGSPLEARLSPGHDERSGRNEDLRGGRVCLEIEEVPEKEVSTEEQEARLKKAAADLSRLLSRVDYENGNVSWSREIAIAQQRLEEAMLWALKAVSK
jgi:hypothetical protein